jgi:decaprenylphospho-beta-D-ribofuranose 2-oxidase
VDVVPDDPVFRATTGGMGLTGVVVDADVRLRRVETSSMLVDTWREPTSTR